MATGTMLPMLNNDSNGGRAPMVANRHGKPNQYQQHQQQQQQQQQLNQFRFNNNPYLQQHQYHQQLINSRDEQNYSINERNSSSQNDQNYQLNSNNSNNSSSTSKKSSRKVVFYKNGDKYFGGKLVTITPNRYYSFRDLMSDLNKSVDLPYGVRRVYTPVSGREIYDIDELIDGSSYVCASFEPFRSVKYGDSTDKHWNSNMMHQNRQELGPTSQLPNSLPSLTNANASVNHSQGGGGVGGGQQQGQYLPRQYIRTIPVVANTNGGFVLSNRNGNRNNNNMMNHSSQGIVAISNNTLGPPLTNRSNGQQQQQQQLLQQHPMAASEVPTAAMVPSWSKPRVITIVRATERPRKKITILLNRKALHSYEQFVCDISEAFGLPQWKNDKIRKLLTTRGRKVQGISDFFRDDDMFIGVSGKEPLNKDLIMDVLHEIYPGNDELVSALYKDWETSRSKSRAAERKARNNSVDYQNANNLVSNSQNHVNNYNNKENAQSLNNLDDPNLPDMQKKSKYYVEFDENGRRKKKKKVLDTDVLLEMELQRQRERLKLMEIERKKRELNTKTNEKDNGQNNSKNLNTTSKRVNIVTPPSNENANDAGVQTDNTNARKPKRRPKFRKQPPPGNNNNNNNQANIEETHTSENNNQKNTSPTSDDHPPTSRSRNAKSKSPGATTPKDRKQAPHSPPPTAPAQPAPANVGPRAHSQTQPQTQRDQQRQNAKSSLRESHPAFKMKRQISNASYVSEKYEFMKTLGDGNFAIVKQARLKSNDHEYAVKIIDKSKMKGKESMIDNEIYIMKSCNHANIVKLYEAFETKDEVYLVTDLVKGGDLFDAITQSVKFNEREASSMVQDICEALFYLHSKNVVHRDLKPENLLVMRKKDDQISIKLADFGLAMEVKEPIYTVCGTPTYVAPEILSERGYGLEVDMWACGVITYILLCGFPPFRSLDRNQDELFQYILAGEYDYLMPYWEGISESSKDLIDHLLVVDVKRRWKAEDVLTHPWIVSQGNSKPLPPNFDDHKSKLLDDLKSKAKVYAAEPFASK